MIFSDEWYVTFFNGLSESYYYLIKIGVQSCDTFKTRKVPERSVFYSIINTAVREKRILKIHPQTWE